MPYLYGDLSGGGADQGGVLVAAGYIGLEDQWVNAVAAWKAILVDADAKVFHATDFFSAHGEFSGKEWKYEHPTKGLDTRW